MDYVVLRDRIYLVGFPSYGEAYEYVLKQKRDDFRHGHISPYYEIRHQGERVDTREKYPLRGAYTIPEAPA